VFAFKLLPRSLNQYSRKKGIPFMSLWP